MTDIDKLIGKKTVIPIILILISVIVFISFSLRQIPSKKYSFWPGYHILLLDKQDNSSVSLLLQNENHFEEVISRYSTEVEYTNYNELKKVGISSLENRFNMLDPRLDRYMKSLPLFFFTESEGEEKEIIYLKTSLSEDESSELLSELIPEKTAWEIASAAGSRSSFLYPLLFAVITASLVYVKKMKSFFFFFISAVWIAVLIKTDISFFYVSVINIVFISYMMEIIELIMKNWFGSGKFSIDIVLDRKNMIISVAVFIISNILIALVNPSVKLFLVFASVFSAECIILYLDLAYSLKKASGYIHRIFSSIAILESNKSRIFDRWLIIRPVYFYLFVLVITFPAVFLTSEKSSCMLPQPVKVQGITGDDLFSGIKEISGFVPENSNEIYLPDISDYFTHLAYQIRLPYKSDYSLPEKNEKIIISHYKSINDNFKEGKKTACLFTDSWLKDKIIYIQETGLTGLMLSEDIPVKIVYTDTSSVINPVYFGSIFCGFYIALIFMVIWKAKTEKTNYEKHILPVIKRRKQQAA